MSETNPVPEKPVIPDNSRLDCVEGDVIRMSQCMVNQVTGQSVDLVNSLVRGVQADTVNLQNGVAGVVQGKTINQAGSAAAIISAQESAINDSMVGVFIGQNATFNDSRNGVVVAGEVHASKIQSVVFWGREVNAPVETVADQRSVALFGLSVGIAMGLVLSLFRLFKNR